jgi:hypothetical protein
LAGAGVNQAAGRIQPTARQLAIADLDILNLCLLKNYLKVYSIVTH